MSHRKIASDRRRNSGGQALVLVTLSLFAMAGMMGLAVDLGWSFFVQKHAQAAADASALGAVTEGFKRLRGSGSSVTGFTCADAGTGATQLECQTTAVNCASVTSTSNLNNGCQYAKKNGFDWTAPRQNVTIQSNDGQTANLPPTAPGVINISYWVTVRTVQTIPQMFAAIGGNSEGTVAALATAAIAASFGPGDFYGMNRAGDCTNSKDGTHCGTDIVTSTGQGGNNCPAPYAGVQGQVCAPAGITLSSRCNAVSKGVCDDGYAGDSRGSGVAGASLTILNGGSVDNTGGGYHNMSNQALTPVHKPDGPLFQDFYKGISQPPLALNATGTGPLSGNIGACGYLNGAIPSTVTTLGPYQYYSFHVGAGGVHIPDGQPITVPTGIAFSPTFSGCPDGGLPLNVDSQLSGAATQNTNFPTYVFYGGLLTNSTATFGAGQYVMAGTTSQTGAVFSIGGAVSGNGNTSITGDSATGTSFIFTDANYPGLAAQISQIPNNNQMPTLYQGTLAFKNSTVNLTGMVYSKVTGSHLPPQLDQYGGIAWWQDRRNSYADGYNEASGSAGCVAAFCTGDDGAVNYCNDGGDCAHASTADLNALKTANHVTPKSAGVTLQPGNVNFNMSGAFYQPRGAWLEIVSGTGTLGGPLQVITGALIQGGGNTSLLLAGPTNPIITYKPVLIR